MLLFSRTHQNPQGWDYVIVLPGIAWRIGVLLFGRAHCEWGDTGDAVSGSVGGRRKPLGATVGSGELEHLHYPQATGGHCAHCRVPQQDEAATLCH